MGPSMEQPDQWVFDTAKPLLTPGSIIYYWVYVQYDNAGYWLAGQKHTVNKPKATARRTTTTTSTTTTTTTTTTTPKPTTPAAPPCGQTATTVNGGQPSCAGALIFEDTFEQNSLGTKWQHEIRIPLDTEVRILMMKPRCSAWFNLPPVFVLVSMRWVGAFDSIRFGSRLSSCPIRTTPRTATSRAVVSSSYRRWSR